MYRCFRHAKIHNATVTDCNVSYEGSIEIDKKLLQAVGISQDEKVQVLDITNGNRLETYVIPSDEVGSICLNGAAAKLVEIGDKIIIIAYCWMEMNGIDLSQFKPKTIILDEDNEIIETK